jgi:hypothetical protein
LPIYQTGRRILPIYIYIGAENFAYIYIYIYIYILYRERQSDTDISVGPMACDNFQTSDLRSNLYAPGYRYIYCNNTQQNVAELSGDMWPVCMGLSHVTVKFGQLFVSILHAPKVWLTFHKFTLPGRPH